MSSYSIDIRPRRQATFPRSLLETLGVSVGDSIKIDVVGKKAVLTPKRQAALDAFSEIQKAFSESNISEKKMLSSLGRGRKA